MLIPPSDHITIQPFPFHPISFGVLSVIPNQLSIPGLMDSMISEFSYAPPGKLAGRALQSEHFRRGQRGDLWVTDKVGGIQGEELGDSVG